MNNNQKAELWMKLVFNALEPVIEGAGKVGWNPLPIHGVPNVLLEQVQALTAQHQSLIPLAETGLEVILLKLFPGMSPSAKVALHESLDMATDKFRQSLRTEKDNQAQALLTEGGTQFRRDIEKLIESERKRIRSQPFSAHFMGLTKKERTTWIEWEMWLEEHDMEAHRALLAFKAKVTSTEDIREVLRHRVSENMAETTKRRMACLRAQHETQEPPVQQALRIVGTAAVDTLLGKETAATGKIKDRLVEADKALKRRMVLHIEAQKRRRRLYR